MKTKEEGITADTKLRTNSMISKATRIPVMPHSVNDLAPLMAEIMMDTYARNQQKSVANARAIQASGDKRAITMLRTARPKNMPAIHTHLRASIPCPGTCVFCGTGLAVALAGSTAIACLGLSDVARLAGASGTQEVCFTG